MMWTLRGRMLLCCCLLLCVVGVGGFLLEDCPRRDPPPNTVVLHPGSSVVLSCSGWVTVDGVRVSVYTGEQQRSTAPSTETHLNHIIAPTAATTTTGRSPPTSTATHAVGDNNTLVTAALYAVEPTVRDQKLDQPQTLPPSDDYDWTAGDDDGDDHDDDHQEDQQGEVPRVTRAARESTVQWRKNGRLLRRGGGGGGQGAGGDRVRFRRRGRLLLLSAVTETDSGAYACQRRNFSVKIHVAGPPEQPILRCYKRSPSSKIRCDWTPQRPDSAHSYTTSLLLYKGQSGSVPSRTGCSYSSGRSRWWCKAAHGDDELRTLMRAVMCVSGLTGSAVSPVLEFHPVDILKPDPPSEVSVVPVEHHSRMLKVSWRSPRSWKSVDNHYGLQYELSYRPLQSTMDDTLVQIGGVTVHWQILANRNSYIITDALPGEEYTVQLRAKEEWDEGDWSDWSPAVYARSWTDQTSNPDDDLPITMHPFYSDYDGSGIQEAALVNGGDQSEQTEVVWYHVLLAASSCVILLVALVAYTLRRVGLVPPCSFHKPSSSSTFSATSSRPQGALFPPCSRHTLPGKEEEQQEREGGEEEEEEQEEATEETKALHFNNSSYFMVHT